MVSGFVSVTGIAMPIEVVGTVKLPMIAADTPNPRVFDKAHSGVFNVGGHLREQRTTESYIYVHSIQTPAAKPHIAPTMRTK